MGEISKNPPTNLCDLRKGRNAQGKYCSDRHAAFFGGASIASANTITVGDGATGTGPYSLVSNSTSPDSYIHVDLSTPIGFSSISSLNAIFSDSTGGADGGSASPEQ